MPTDKEKEQQRINAEVRERNERTRDQGLRKEAVDKAIVFLSTRPGGDQKSAKESLKAVYTDIYEFISNKPYHQSNG
jgi:hypothetical protein